MAALASFKAFLNTGHLGPMRPGLSMNEVANLLGPPPDWIANGDAFGPAPSYWCYNFLEISFRCDTDFRCDWFQIEDASGLRGDAVKLADDLIMTLDGLSGDAPVSRFIEAIDDIDRVQIILTDIAGYPNPIMWIGDNVEIFFGADTAENETLFEQTSNPQDRIRALEEVGGIDSVYSYYYFDSEDEARRLDRRAKFRDVTVSGREFLAALK